MAYCGILDNLLEIDGEPVDFSRLDEGIIIAGDEEYEAEDFINEEDILHFFNNNALRTKKDLLKDIGSLMSEIERDREKDTAHSAAFYDQYMNLVKRFNAEVESLVFPEKLEDWWRYEYDVRVSGITLMLKHVGYLKITRDDCIDEDVDTVFNLIHIKTKLLTVEQYAQAYDVIPTTVRQWIRRGKIRSAIKKGIEWMIPEIAEVMTRGYTRGQYRRTEYLTDLPAGYEFFNDYDRVVLNQNWKDKGLFDVTFKIDFDPKKVPEEEWEKYKKEIQMDQKDREKFELYLISNPFVEADDTYLASRG